MVTNIRTGLGFDSHRLVEGRELIIGGAKIPFEKGLMGHSDADVLLHAIMDALLGAAALALGGALGLYHTARWHLHVQDLRAERSATQVSPR